MKTIKFLLLAFVLAGLGWFGFATRATWLPWLGQGASMESDIPPEEGKAATKIIVSEQAQKNLGLTAKSIQPAVYWRSTAIPGMVIDRPGFSDRGIVSPASAVVVAIHHVPGDAVRPGEALFTVRLLSETLQLTQTELFKSSQESLIAEEKLKRLKNLAATGTESSFAVIEAENQVRRLGVATKAYRQELLTRGMSVEQINGVADGKFVSELTLFVPPRSLGKKNPGPITPVPKEDGRSPTSEVIFEVQELKVDLGQQVQAGQTLCVFRERDARNTIEGSAQERRARNRI